MGSQEHCYVGTDRYRKGKDKPWEEITIPGDKEGRKHTVRLSGQKYKKLVHIFLKYM